MLKHIAASAAALAITLVSSLAVTAAQAPAAKPVDVCRLLTTAEAGAIVGGDVNDATPDSPQGSLLGGCKYFSMSGLIMLNARPSGEFDASVRAYKDLQAVDAGPGVKAYFSPTVGMLMSQTGKPYFVHITIAGAKGPKTSERFVAIAKKVIAKN